jgi:hypothetical protein
LKNFLLFNFYGKVFSILEMAKLVFPTELISRAIDTSRFSTDFESHEVFDELFKEIRTLATAVGVNALLSTEFEEHHIDVFNATILLLETGRFTEDESLAQILYELDDWFELRVIYALFTGGWTKSFRRHWTIFSTEKPKEAREIDSLELPNNCPARWNEFIAGMKKMNLL